MANLFSSPEHAELYVRYRPTYPGFVYDKIFQVLDDDSEATSRRRRLAVDVGCGSGQTTRALAEHFEKVLGMDESEAQLNEARKSCAEASNASFECESADRLDEIVDEGSVDLVTIAAAAHYFGTKSFFEKCLKVLRAGGVMAAYCYSFGFDECDNPDAGKLSAEFYRDILKGHFDERVRHSFNKYKDLSSILAEVFPKTERWSRTVVQKRSLKEIAGFIRTMSAYRSFREQNPTLEDPILPLVKRLKVVYGVDSEDEQVVNLPMEYFMIIGKKV